MAATFVAWAPRPVKERLYLNPLSNLQVHLGSVWLPAGQPFHYDLYWAALARRLSDLVKQEQEELPYLLQLLLDESLLEPGVEIDPENPGEALIYNNPHVKSRLRNLYIPGQLPERVPLKSSPLAEAQLLEDDAEAEAWVQALVSRLPKESPNAVCPARQVLRRRDDARCGELDDAVEAVVTPDEVRKRFLAMVNRAARIYKAILPDPLAKEFAPDTVLLSIIASKIRILSPKPDISEVMDDVEALLNDSIATEPYRIEAQEKPTPLVDLSKIDFEKLAQQFETSRKRTEAERLQALIGKKLSELLRFNKGRVDFLEKFSG